MTKKKNKTLLVVAISTLIALAIFGFVFYRVLSNTSKPVEDFEKYSLDESFYHTDGKKIEISKESDNVGEYLEKAKAEKKDFVVYVSLPVCSDETALFRDFVTKYQKEHEISFLYLTTAYVKETDIQETIKYFPSVILYKDGKIVKYLDFNSNADMEYYKSYEGFSRWFETYINV